MRTAISAAMLLACALSAESQIVASLTRSPAGAPEIRIRNDARTSLAAFAVAMNPSREAEEQSQFVVFFDPLIDDMRPLQPAQERSIPAWVRPGNRIEDWFQPQVITAGILSDGSITGDTVLLARLVLRRCNMLLAVETALDTLSEAGKHNVIRAQLIEQFRRSGDSVWRWYMPPEQQVGRGLYRSMMEKLRNIPEGPAGSPFPPSAFVAEEMTALNRRRVALLESQPGLAAATLMTAR